MTKFKSNPAPDRPEPRAPRRRVHREVSALRAYEVMIILDPGLEEDVIRATIDRATALVRAQGGTPGTVDRWGKRRFAYELNHRWEGLYLLMEATAEPAAMAELNRMLSLADEVIRHKVIRLPDVPRTRSRRAAVAAGADTSDGSRAKEN
ncbi:MAG: 30S ribosomal protein S6 [Acidimicrobiales bacterium]